MTDDMDTWPKDEREAVLYLQSPESGATINEVDISRYSLDLEQRLLKRFRRGNTDTESYHLSTDGKLYRSKITLALPDSPSAALVPPPPAWATLRNLLCYGLPIPVRVKIIPNYQINNYPELKPFYCYWNLQGATREPHHYGDDIKGVCTGMSHQLMILLLSTLTFNRIKNNRVRQEILLAGTTDTLRDWNRKDCTFRFFHASEAYDCEQANREGYGIELDEESMTISADSFILSHIRHYQDQLRDLISLPKELITLMVSYIIL